MKHPYFHERPAMARVVAANVGLEVFGWAFLVMVVLIGAVS